LLLNEEDRTKDTLQYRELLITPACDI